MNHNTLPLTTLNSHALAQAWHSTLRHYAPSVLSDGMLLSEVEGLAETFCDGLTTSAHPAFTLVGEQVVELGIDAYEPLAQVQNSLTQWLTLAMSPEQMAPVLTAFNLGAYRALHQRLIQTELHRQQHLQAQLNLRTQLNAFAIRLQRELARPDQERMELVGVTLGMLLREFTADGAAFLTRRGNHWGLRLTQGTLPPRLFILDNDAPAPPLPRALHASIGGQHQIVIPVPVSDEHDLLLLVAEEWKISVPETALDQFALVGHTLATFLRTLQHQEARQQGQASQSYLPADTIHGYTTGVGEPLSPLTNAPPLPLSLDPHRAVLPLEGVSGTGRLIVEGEESREWNEDELELMNVVAEQIAQAWERTRLGKENESRSRQLQAAAEVSRAASSLLQLDKLLDKAVTEILRAFPNIYHAQVFLVDDDNENAVLQASTGKPGEQLLAIRHFLPVNSPSIVGRATGKGEVALIRDTDRTESGNAWKPNQYLPETRAELAIPLKIGDRVMGCLDVQSRFVDAFAPADIPVLETMADQLTIAIENARAYEQQQLTLERLREVDNLKSTFLANMSHELRTPLNSIIGFSRLILKGIDGPITEVQRADLDTIHSSGQHLLGLIDTLLDHAKIEAGKMELDVEDVDLQAVIETVMRVANGLAKDKKIRLQKEIPHDLPIMRGDPVRIRQVLMNLLSNAIKFTEEGYVRLTVTHTREEVMFSVSDSGLGIPPDKQEHLFEAFYQVDGSATRKVGGTGLGLAISQSFVQMHNGQIWVESRGIAGQGATFHVVLPLSGPLIMPTSNTNPLVMAVDDEVGMTSLYEKYLTADGYRFAACNDPRRAVDDAVRLSPALILVDVRMPQINGLELLETLRRHSTLKDTPIIICSIEARERIAEAALHAGATEVLQKPINRQTLTQILQRIIGPAPSTNILSE